MLIDIKTNPHHTTWNRLLETWQRADATDFIEGAWLFDHFYPIFGDTDGPCMEAWTTLSALTQATSRMQVGTMVNGMPYRHPALTANMAASVDIISNGRFQLGLGAGWNQQEADAYGISLGDTLKDRMDMFDEGVEVIISLLSSEETTFDGRHFTLANARNEPKGPQRPHPPIVIGGGGEKRTLRTVARYAQHWNMTPVEIDQWIHKREVLERHCEDIGRDSSEIICSILLRFDPSDPDAMVRAIHEAETAGLDKAIVNFPKDFAPDNVDVLADLVARL